MISYYAIRREYNKRNKKSSLYIGTYKLIDDDNTVIIAVQFSKTAKKTSDHLSLYVKQAASVGVGNPDLKRIVERDAFY